MKRTTTILKAAFSVLWASVAAYFGQLLAPVLVLLGVMTLDYITGMIKAYLLSQLSSRIGIRGILKKVSCMAMVAVGVAADYLLRSALVQAGITLHSSLFCGLLTAVWLIVNELISILENLSAIGVPGFPRMEKLLKHLKNAVNTMEEDEHDA